MYVFYSLIYVKEIDLSDGPIVLNLTQLWSGPCFGSFSSLL